MNTKKLVQGALIAALFGVMGVLNTLTATFFDSLIGYIMAVPVVWYGYQYSLKDSLAVSFVSSFIVFMQGMPYFFMIAVYTCVFGCFLGESLKRKLDKNKIIIGCFLISIIYNVLVFEIFSALLGISLKQELSELIRLSGFLIQLPYAGIVYQSIDLLSFFMILISFFENYLVLLIVQFIFTRLKIEFYDNYHISTFYLDKRTGFTCFIVLLISLILTHYYSLRIINYALSLSIFIFLLNGISLISLYFIYTSKPQFNSIGFLLMFIPIINIAVAVLGFIDIISDLRGKIMYNKHRGTSYD